MDKAYWLERKRASMAMARSSTCSAARLAHYDLAGRYSVKAASAGRQASPPLYATGSNPPFEDTYDG